VIKIEDPRGGDSMRHLGAQRERVDGVFERLNRGKRSVTLDLRSPDAAAVLDALAATSDVVIDSFRPSTARRLRVDAASLHARHPRVICASINGFGQSGPDVERAAHDINYQALAGLLDPGARPSAFAEATADRRSAKREGRSTGSGRAVLGTGATDAARENPLALSLSKGEPQMPGPLVGDIGAAMQAALRIVAALFERARTGSGSIVDIAISHAARAWTQFPTTADLASACYNLYETADGEWLALGALEPKFWSRFCERIGRPDLTTLQHVHGEDGARVLREVRAVMKTRTRDAWLAIFAADDVCLTPVKGMAHLDADTQGVPAAPALGADTDQVLEQAGIDRERRAALRAAGVI
jgi:alpha-methylacyl-CoA racemase